MAQLPDWTALGTSSVPTPSFRRVQPDNAGQVLDVGIQNLAKGAGDVANDEYEQQQKQHALDVNLARSKANVAVANHEIAVKGLTEQIQQDVGTGKLPYDQAQQAYTDQVAKIPVPQIANLDPAAQTEMQGHVQQHVALSGLAINGTVELAKRNDFKDQFVQLLDAKGKLAGMPDADIEGINNSVEAFKPLAVQAGIPAAEIDRTLDHFKENNWLNNANQRAMVSKDDPHALAVLQHDLVDSDGFFAGKLDTNKRNEVLRTVINDQLILENRAEHLQDKREAHAQSTVNQINEQIASGVPATPVMWSQWESATKGTSAEPEFRQALADETTVQSVLREPVDKQIQFVQDQQKRLMTEGGSMRDRANLMRLQTAVQSNVNLMQKQPLLFAATRNGVDPQPLDLSKVNSQDGQQAIADTINDRMSTLNAMRKQYGPQVALQPLLPQEAAQLNSQLENAKPSQRAQLLVGLRGAFKNDDAYQAAMRQAAPNHPVTAIAGQMVGESAPSSTPVWFDQKFATPLSNVQRILAGDALLNPGKGADEEKTGFKGGFPMPPDSTSQGSAGLRADFAAAAGTMFSDRPQLADAHYSVFKAAYAQLASEQGNVKGTLDHTIEQQALKIALGTPANFNGSTVSVPSGMDPTRFTGLVQNAVGAAAKAWGAPPDWTDKIRGYQLHELGSVGSGRYALMNGNAHLTRPDGKGPFVIDLKNQFLPANAKGSPEDDARRGIKPPVEASQSSLPPALSMAMSGGPVVPGAQ